MRCADFFFCFGLCAFLSSAARQYPFDCTVQSNVTMVEDSSATQVQFGGASELQAGFKEPWPEVIRNGQKVRVVTYCYASAVDREELDCPWVRDAFDRWEEKLNEPRFAGTTNLKWEELSDGNSDPAKRRPTYCFDRNGDWNSQNVPADTLSIELDDDFGGSGYSSVGYNALETRPGRHFLRLGPNIPIGHVFGMTHEASRHDRDEYLVFECKNLIGYSSIIAKAMVDHQLDHADAHDKLCRGDDFARGYNFPSTEYAKDLDINRQPDGPSHDEPTGFDFDSIMLYPSLSFSDRTACQRDLNFCPIIRKSPRSLITPNTHPSDKDAMFVQRWYPRPSDIPLPVSSPSSQHSTSSASDQGASWEVR